MLTDCMHQKKQVRIYYQSLTEWEEICTCINPYRIMFCRRSWYVIGRSSIHREIRTFNIGRILNAEPVDFHYRVPARFNLERYLGNAWSMIREKGQRHEIKIRFKKMVAYNVAEVAWHKTQKIEWNEDESMDFHVTVDGLNEISWWIMGYGSQAEVLEPPELRKIISKRASEMKKIYSKKTAKKNKKSKKKEKGKKKIEAKSVKNKKTRKKTEKKKTASTKKRSVKKGILPKKRNTS
jgi:predicted DNA-binding transcriptional regulator YafY